MSRKAAQFLNILVWGHHGHVLCGAVIFLLFELIKIFKRSFSCIYHFKCGLILSRQRLHSLVTMVSSESWAAKTAQFLNILVWGHHGHVLCGAVIFLLFELIKIFKRSFSCIYHFKCGLILSRQRLHSLVTMVSSESWAAKAAQFLNIFSVRTQWPCSVWSSNIFVIWIDQDF